eukprot:Hpha_TRINITY_DN15957_c0_g1::TRINITY_DN15957_c0_g1_i1::g.73185::m.73185
MCVLCLLHLWKREGSWKAAPRGHIRGNARPPPHHCSEAGHEIAHNLARVDILVNTLQRALRRRAKHFKLTPRRTRGRCRFVGVGCFELSPGLQPRCKPLAPEIAPHGTRREEWEAALGGGFCEEDTELNARTGDGDVAPPCAGHISRQHRA